MTRPLRSTFITKASSLLRAGPPAHPRNGTQSLTVSAAWDAPSRHPLRDHSVGARLLTFRATAADQAHVASMPDTERPGDGTPAKLIPEQPQTSGSDVT